MKVRRYLPLSGVSIPHLILISSLIFSSIPDSQVKTFGPSVRSHPLLCVKCFPGSLSSKAITLRSIQIYNTHEFLGPHPTIYFYCKGENKTILPDVKEKHFSYIFYGEESWQPLTELPGKKCKRCGLYEFDTIKSDDVFDEWDLCLDDFINGISIHYKAKQFNATLLCEDCQVATDSAQTSSSSDGSANKKIDLILVVVISVLVSIMATIVTVGAYKYWQKRKREKDQAHFLKLFEEGDDIEDELGLSM